MRSIKERNEALAKFRKERERAKTEERKQFIVDVILEDIAKNGSISKALRTTKPTFVTQVPTKKKKKELKSGNMNGGIKPAPFSSKPNIKPAGQHPTSKDIIDVHKFSKDNS